MNQRGSDALADHDLVVLGGGSGGYACALRAAQLGLSVSLVERDRLGGTCLHRGCIPTKALLHAAEIADSIAEGGTLGVHASLDRIDMAALHAFKSRVIDRLYRGLSGLVEAAGITVVAGEGVVAGPTTIEVGDRRLRGHHLVLATGAKPRLLPGVSLGPRVLDSDSALALPRIPERVVIIGGSVIGVEFASLWRSLGAEVVIVEGLASLVPLEDPVLSRYLARAFAARGIQVRTGVLVETVVEDSRRAIVGLVGGEQLEADVVLIAVGRVPTAAELGLEEHGIDVDHGHVVVDERLTTSRPDVRAVGDLVRGPQLAHRGFAHGIFVAEDIAGLHPAPIDDAEIPRVTYCEPELASVGLTEPSARRRYGDVEVYDYSLAGNGRSQILATGGFVRLVRRTDGPIVGVHLAGARVGEQVGEAMLAVGWEAHPEDLARFIHAHPTQNEAIGEAAMALAGRPLHSHP